MVNTLPFFLKLKYRVSMNEKVVVSGNTRKPDFEVYSVFTDSNMETGFTLSSD